MKKIASIALVILLVCSFTVPAFASSGNANSVGTVSLSSNNVTVVHSEITYFPDGSYIIDTVYEIEDVGAVSTFSSAPYIRTGFRNVGSYMSNGSIIWQFTLSGTWTVTPGVSAVCTNSQITTTINNSTWKFSNGNSWTEANRAHGSGTFTQYSLWVIPVATVNVNIWLGCDVNGNLFIP